MSLFKLCLLLLYILAARCTLAYFHGKLRDFLFAALNVAGIYCFFYYNSADFFQTSLHFLGYMVLVIFQYGMLSIFAERKNWTPWLAFFTPILALIALRYMPIGFYTGLFQKIGGSFHSSEPQASFSLPVFVGLSYLAFRSSHLVLDVRNGGVKKPSLWEYLGFCFFVPTLSVGPINTYSNHSKAFSSERPDIPAGRAILRILVGAVKYQFLGNLCQRLDYAELLNNGHYHHWIDFPIAALAFYLYLYCNFSGFCDIAIGMAGLIGIPVTENFNSPFKARNVKDFWNRWHITLSNYMRDVVFSPLSKFLVRLFGVQNANHAIAVTIGVVFLLVGIWHGVGWNFAIYGAIHALGVIANHYYTIGLKKWLGRDGFKAYNENRWIHAIAVVLTFCYCGGSLFFFANNFVQIREILSTFGPMGGH